MKICIATHLFVLILFSGCSEQRTEDQKKASHDDQHQDLQILEFHKGYELFAEVHHHDTTYLITAHVTKLQNYSPADLNTPEWFLQDSSGETKTVLKPVSEGIYRGQIKKSYDVNHLHGIRFQADGVNLEIKNREDSYYPAKEASHDGITFTKEDAWKSHLRIKAIDSSQFTATLKTTGKLGLAPGSVNTVTAGIRGKAYFTAPGLMEGTPVKRGQALFVIVPSENTPENHRTALRKAEKNLERADKEYQRAKSLFQADILSESELLDAKLAFDLASENYEALASGNSSNGLQITAPSSGFIDNIHIENGEHISTGTLLCTIIPEDDLILKADIPQEFYTEMQSVSSYEFQVPGSNFRSAKMPIDPEKMVLSKSLSSGYASVSLPLNNVPGLLPGAYAEVYFALPSEKPRIVVPKTALMESEGNHYVYVMTGGERFEKREVITGQENRDYIVIKQGLKSGNLLVTEGAYNLKLASMAGNVPSHNHDH